MESDILWMRRALELADRAELDGEVPVGALVVRDGEFLGEGWNRNIGDDDPSAHAEIVAMRAAGKKEENHRLPDSTLYVTLEPCAMCVGAMIHARIGRLVYAASDPKTGAMGGAYDLQGIHAHNHVIDVTGGVLGEEAADRLRSFFRKRR